MAEPFLNPDEAMEKSLLSLAENEEETAALQPPVVNIFRLRMEAERRRSRRQVQAVTIAVWFSVTTTLGILCYFILSLLPELEKGFFAATTHWPSAERVVCVIRSVSQRDRNRHVAGLPFQRGASHCQEEQLFCAEK